MGLRGRRCKGKGLGTHRGAGCGAEDLVILRIVAIDEPTLAAVNRCHIGPCLAASLLQVAGAGVGDVIRPTHWVIHLARVRHQVQREAEPEDMLSGSPACSPPRTPR